MFLRNPNSYQGSQKPRDTSSKRENTNPSLDDENTLLEANETDHFFQPTLKCEIVLAETPRIFATTPHSLALRNPLEDNFNTEFGIDP